LELSKLVVLYKKHLMLSTRQLLDCIITSTPSLLLL